MTSAQGGIEIRRADDRGTTRIAWLHSRHSFSFGRYYDPRRESYHSLRVLNDDIISPGGGFAEHGHEHMEIISWVLEGRLAHADSTGNRGTLKPGDVQVMSAGRGIRHSEANASGSAPLHLLQIWLEPDTRDLDPFYTQKFFPAQERLNRWQLVASPDERDGSLRIHQDAALSIADLSEGQRLDFAINRGRHGYLHLALGRVRIGEAELAAGDALTLDGSAREQIEALDQSQVLLFDLP